MSEKLNWKARLSQAIAKHGIAEHSEESTEPQLRQPSQIKRLIQWLTPNGGTILLVLLVALTQSVWANSTQNNPSASTTTISYQGRLADAAGAPLTGVYNMEFRIYTQPAGGDLLWTEFWTGGNSVQVSDGLFNVMLGSINPALVSAIQGRDELYLGITIDTDTEMAPRIQLGSVPFSMQALTVADGSITTIKIVDGSVTSGKLANNSVTTGAIADGSITASKLAPGLDLIPAGTIVMWSGSIASIPSGWALCDGSNGTPDLRDRFVVGAGGAYSVGSIGGANSVTLTTNQIPSHTHSGSSSPAGAHTHSASSSTHDGAEFSQSSTHGGGVNYGMGTIHYNNNQRLGTHSHTITVGGVDHHTHSITIGSTGSGQGHENRPPYYSLAYIMKLP